MEVNRPRLICRLPRPWRIKTPTNENGMQIKHGSSPMTSNTEVVAVQSRLLDRDSSVAASAFMKTQLISVACQKPIARYYGRRFFTTCAVSSLFRQVDLASARKSLCRGLGSGWFTERFHGNALVAHFQHGQVFCAARQLKGYAVTRCRLHQRAPQR